MEWQNFYAISVIASNPKVSQQNHYIYWNEMGIRFAGN